MDLAQTGSVSALTLALTQVAKPFVQARYVPLLSIGIGVLISVAFTFSKTGDWVTGIVEGVVAGLVASGVYDQKKLLKK